MRPGARPTRRPLDAAVAASLPFEVLPYALALVCILLPTPAALPRFAATRGHSGDGTISGLYALNTSGAAAGAALTGFPWIRYLGVSASNRAVAVALLASSSYSIRNIAQDVGEGAVTFFYRLFRKRTGLTPGQYRERLAGGRLT
jgi:hypothetical protein